MLNKLLNILNKLSLRKKRHNTEQLRYLSQSVLIEEATTPYMVRTTLMIVSVTIITFIIWAAITDINEISRSTGEVIPVSYVQSIQHLEGGIVSVINVKEGDVVEKGAVLAVLDGTAIKQDLSQLSVKQLTLEMQAERLRAFVNHLEPDFNKITTDSEELKKAQFEAFQSMVTSRESEKQVLQKQINQKQESLTILASKKSTLEENVKLVQEEHELKKNLSDQGYLSKVSFIEIQKNLNQVKGEINSVDSEINQATSAIEEASSKLVALEAKNRDDAYQQLDTIDASIAENAEHIKKLQNQVSRLEIKAPVYGLVKGVNIKTIGGVISSGQLIMEVVPLDATLLVECRILPKDIGHIKKGQDVRVKVSSYDFSKYGVIDGTLENISATTFSENGSHYYMGRVALKQNYVGKNPGHNLILPGMTVEADILTGKKTILAYLLKPIQAAASEALTER